MSGNTDEDQEEVEEIKMHCELISVHENHNHGIKMKKKKNLQAVPLVISHFSVLMAHVQVRRTRSHWPRLSKQH